MKTLDEETVLLTGNDMEISLQVTISAKVEEAGETVLPARFLAEFMRRVPPGEVTLTMGSGDYTAHLASGAMEINLRCMSPLDYPVPPQVEVDDFWRGTQKEFRAALKSVDFAISSDQSRPAMTGMLLITEPGNGRVIAMDGFRFAEKKIEMNTPDGYECVIPSKAITEITRLLAADDEPFEAHIGDNHVMIRLPKILFQSRLIEAPFPFKGAKELIRRDPTTKIMVNRKALANAVERAMLVIREDAKGSNIVRFSFSESTLTISSSSPDLGQITEVVEVELTGEDLVIGFNGRYILDVLGVIDDEKVSFSFTGPLTAAIITPSRNSDFITILSPIRLATQA